MKCKKVKGERKRTGEKRIKFSLFIGLHNALFVDERKEREAVGLRLALRECYRDTSRRRRLESYLARRAVADHEEHMHPVDRSWRDLDPLESAKRKARHTKTWLW